MVMFHPLFLSFVGTTLTFSLDPVFEVLFFKSDRVTKNENQGTIEGYGAARPAPVLGTCNPKRLTHHLKISDVPAHGDG